MQRAYNAKGLDFTFLAVTGKHISCCRATIKVKSKTDSCTYYAGKRFWCFTSHSILRGSSSSGNSDLTCKFFHLNKGVFSWSSLQKFFCESAATSFQKPGDIEKTSGSSMY